MKKYIKWNCGYIRFKKFELNWNIKDIALPLSIDFSCTYFVYIRILFIGIFIFKNENQLNL